jgi:hypothetical protein
VGFREIWLFRLEDELHVAPGLAAGAPVSAAHQRAVLAGLDGQWNERGHKQRVRIKRERKAFVKKFSVRFHFLPVSTMLASVRAMSIRIKICGITSAPDALAAVEAGADALGFIFYEASPRFLKREQAAALLRGLPPFVGKVGVFVNPTEATVRATIAQCGIDTLQFHGEESPDFCRQFGLKVIKAFRVRDASSLERTRDYVSAAWLLDSYAPDQHGGQVRS